MTETDYAGPKSLADPAAIRDRRRRLEAPHVAALTAFVRLLRRRTGKEASIPYFDPLDGGLRAKCLFLFEAPGPRAVASGFVSRNNPDESARNFLELCERAGLPRVHTATWNIVPWYVGSGKRIRPARATDIKEGAAHLVPLLPMLRRLQVVVLGGRKAQRAEESLRSLLPGTLILKMPHTSPQFVNRSPGNRARILRILRRARNAIR